jgi:hypothetical protein
LFLEKREAEDPMKEFVDDHGDSLSLPWRTQSSFFLHFGVMACAKFKHRVYIFIKEIIVTS